ncbi:Polyketide synthase dehydratase [Amycolatopsis xylanica]|uniref:Polyketide synthase dehydratase n=1 Tax=Amycolatopsis xylanica TaxID=589385 RepID=A0A1H3D4D6_9PSEU|nr:polyketide synthase dehydratase domain-containing protein [Amycolatopsis xylanica]SDX61271.1 Polyketide synthase dehydratase [Amycolatopsis xylanica]
MKYFNAEYTLTARSHPYLADHEVGGALVLPVVMALEWFTHAAREFTPDADVLEIRAVKVYRKLVIEDFGGAGTTVRVACALSDQMLTLDLFTAPGRPPHYRAHGVLGHTRNGSLAGREQPRDLVPWIDDEVYDGRTLFHGSSFQVLRSLTGFSSSGAAGTLVGSRSAGWGDADWHTDPAMLDGGLQIAVLWAELELGGASLPMAVGACRVHRAGLAPGPVSCVVWARQIHDVEAECDIAFFDEDGALRAELFDVSLILRP